MRERAGDAAINLDIDSTIGKGTIVRMKVVGEAANGFEVLRIMLARQAGCRPYGYPDARHGWNSRDVRAFETAADD